MYAFGRRSLQRMEGLHPDLIKVLEMAIKETKQDFSVSEGLRTLERQTELVRDGFSKTLNSRHLTGHAVDLYPYPIKGNVASIPMAEYHAVADAMRYSAARLDVDLEWGWAKWGWDAPHYQLSWRSYPKGG